MGKNKPTRRRKPPKHEVVVHRGTPPPAPFFAELVDTLRAVAGRMIDLADAAAEAVTSRLEGRA